VKTILLALSTTRQSPKTIDYALKKAQKEKAHLVILFIVDPDLPHLVLDKMLDVGFMGDKPSMKIYKSILKEYRERGKKITKEISKAADSLGIEWSTQVEEGEFTVECLKLIEEKKPKMTILTRTERSRLSRFLHGSAVNQLKRKTKCPITIVKEE
jgi:nucleotide-binding universal stress UspA family protein